MPKLYFRYGAMNSSKTANLLIVAHNYRSQGKTVLLVKPDVDTRFGSHVISSRAITGVLADLVIDQEFSDFSPFVSGVSCILVDEAQFLSETNVEALRQVTERVPVICYGLRTDFKSHLFPGSKRLMELADSIEEIKTICVECEHKAIINAKFTLVDGVKNILYSGTVFDLGTEEKYQPMCYQCWFKKSPSDDQK